jgi:hypothetical protein
MRKIFLFILTLTLQQAAIFAQKTPINRQLFFTDENVIEVTLTTDLKKIKTDKKVPTWQPANITMGFEDSTIIKEEIRIEPRGEYRKNNCEIASLMFDFKTPTSPKLSPLKKLKMVAGCRTVSVDEEYLLKEYLVYKIYNIISIMSFKVRLLHINFKDSKQKVKAYSQYAFLIEDMSDMSSRNNCREVKKRQFQQEATNRRHMTLVGLFQYMIGNTDWSVPKYHNIKLMVPKNDTFALPYTIPYDFDYCGLVDATYAVPNEELGIRSVRDRLYRGFERSQDELDEAVNIFKERKGRIMLTINSFTLLSEKTRKNMASYLEDFYKTIDNKRTVKSAFISNARTN